jgi:hypothetical protein
MVLLALFWLGVVLGGEAPGTTSTMPETPSDYQHDCQTRATDCQV